jgi:hypothetical protein
MDIGTGMNRAAFAWRIWIEKYVLLSSIDKEPCISKRFGTRNGEEESAHDSIFVAIAGASSWATDLM